MFRLKAVLRTIDRDLLVRSTGFSRLLLIDVPLKAVLRTIDREFLVRSTGFSRLLLIDVPPEGGTPNYRSRPPGSEYRLQPASPNRCSAKGGTPNYRSRVPGSEYRLQPASPNRCSA